MPNRKYSDIELIHAVSQERSIATVLQRLGLKPTGGNYATIKRLLILLEIDTSHFVAKHWRRGARTAVVPAMALEQILVENSSYSSHRLKKRLFTSGLKARVCELCCLTVWQGKPIPLELHHKNGIKTDCRIENLQILCPNCHALTDNYRGKNKKGS